MQRTARILALVGLLAASRDAWPQGGTPLGPEFRINTYTTSVQGAPSVDADPAGNFVVVWSGPGQGDPTGGIFGQRFAISGVPLGPEFRVNTYTTDFQLTASVAADAAGNFVVAWVSSGGYGGAPADVLGQRYAGDGTPLGPEFRINTYAAGSQARPAVAADPAGNFVVVWDGEGQGDQTGVFGQRFSSSGAALGPEFRVNSATAYFQDNPSVATDAAGNFVVAWHSSDGYASTFADVLGQRYASDGTPLGTEFRVNTLEPGGQGSPAVAADPAGNFVVVWSGDGIDDGNGVFGQRFAISGSPVGPEFRVHAYTTDLQFLPTVAADAAGNFVVAWTTSGGYGGTPPDVFGRRFANDGTPQDVEFLINTYTTSGQSRAAVAADPTTGNFVVVWESYGQDGSSFGVFGQRYGRIVPVELMRFGVE